VVENRRGAGRSSQGRAGEAGHAAEEIVERHGRIGEADHADHDPKADGGGAAQAAGKGGIVGRRAHSVTSPD
jgi:hypothetical protein